MNPIVVSAFVGACVGGGIVAAASWARPSPEAPPPAPIVASSPPAASTSGAPAPLELGPVVARIDQVLDRVLAIEAKVDEALAAPQRTAVSPPVGSPSAVDADSLQQALAEVERRKFAAQSDDALRQIAWNAMQGGPVDEGLRALDVLRDRAHSADERAKLQTDLGMLQRARGSDADLAASAKTLQAVIDETGLDSARGLGAAYQMVWTENARKDPAAGLRWAESVASSANASPDQRLQARWAAAIMVQNLGDQARARARFEGLLREVEGQPALTKLEEDLRRRLATLEGK